MGGGGVVLSYFTKQFLWATSVNFFINLKTALMKSLESHIITVLFSFLILGTFCPNFQADSFSSFYFIY